MRGLTSQNTCSMGVISLYKKKSTVVTYQSLASYDCWCYRTKSDICDNAILKKQIIHDLSVKNVLEETSSDPPTKPKYTILHNIMTFITSGKNVCDNISMLCVFVEHRGMTWMPACVCQYKSLLDLSVFTSGFNEGIPSAVPDRAEQSSGKKKIIHTQRRDS